MNDWTNTAKPVTIRGKRFPSLSAAARALGVHRRAVGLAMRDGKLDRVGLGRWPRPRSQEDRGARQ